MCPSRGPDDISDMSIQLIKEELDRVRSSEQYYRNIVESASKGVVVVDKVNTIVYVNPKITQMLGYSYEELIGENFLKFIDEEFCDLFQSKLAKYSEKSEGLCDFKFRRKDGAILWALVSISPQYDKEKNVIGSNFMLSDITERKEAEIALQKSEDALAKAQRIAHIGNWTWDIGKDEMYLSVEAAKIFGLNTHETDAYEKILSLIHPDDRASFMEKNDRSLYKGENYSFEFRIIRPGKVERFIHSDAEVTRNKKGEPIAMFGTTQDITERRQAEMALFESEEKFRTLAEMSPIAIFFHSGDGFIYANPAAETITGYSKDELNTMKFWELFDPMYSEMIKKRGLSRLQGENPPSRYEVKLRTKHEKWMDIISARVLYKGKPTILTMGIDTTRNKQAETALKTSKEESELYVDIMSHDIGNMNQAMMGYLEMAIDMLKPEGLEKELLEKPLDIITNSSLLIDNVKKLRRLQSGEIPYTIVDMGQILSEVKEEHMKTPGRDVTINYNPPTGYKIIANEALKDVFSSLVDNAIKHSSGPLTIDISIDMARVCEKEYYRVAITDNGPGITDELKKKIFTDIKDGNGKGIRRGIGLQLVKTFISAYHGEVRVGDRVPGDYTQGARFEVLIPAIES